MSCARASNDPGATSVDRGRASRRAPGRSVASKSRAARASGDRRDAPRSRSGFRRTRPAAESLPAAAAAVASAGPASRGGTAGLSLDASPPPPASSPLLPRRFIG